ncbi:MAG: trigger factor [candidate division KSB1 bacterium]|nr:trigger factor [candidate division KSB1 bacterium]
MEVQIAEQGQWERSIDVTVPYSEMAPRFDEAYAKYKKSMQLEGFRKGKVPVDLIKKLFGSKIEKEVAEEAVPDILEDVIKKYDVNVYDVSKIDGLQFNRDSGLKFQALVKIKPEVSLDKYKELVVEKEIYRITDEDMDEAIENLREQQATMINIDGAAQEGHYLVADLQRTDATGVPLVGQKYENRYFRLSSEEAENEFVNQLLGAKAGDTRQIVLHPPRTGNETPAPEYYSVLVKEVKEKKLPSVDDELAKDVGNFENLEALKQAIRQNLELQAQQNAQQNLDNRIIDEVIKNNPIDLPEFMVEGFLKNIIESMKKENRGNLDEQEIRERYRADAIYGLKWRMLREKIVELEHIEVTDAEVDDYIEKMAQRAGKNAPLVRSNYRSEKKRDQVRDQLEEKKVIDLLLKHAVITEKIVTYQDRKKTPQLAI